MTTERGKRGTSISVSQDTVEKAKVLGKLTDVPYRGIIGALAAAAVDESFNRIRSEIQQNMSQTGDEDGSF